MQLNTFFCYRGVDSNLRFALINLAGLGLITLFDALLASHGILIFISLLLSIVVGLSACRRLQGQKSPLTFLPAVSLLFVSIGLVYHWSLLSVIFAFLYVFNFVVFCRVSVQVSSYFVPLFCSFSGFCLLAFIYLSFFFFIGTFSCVLLLHVFCFLDFCLHPPSFFSFLPYSTICILPFLPLIFFFFFLCMLSLIHFCSPPLFIFWILLVRYYLFDFFY